MNAADGTEMTETPGVVGYSRWRMRDLCMQGTELLPKVCTHHAVCHPARALEVAFRLSKLRSFRV